MKQPRPTRIPLREPEREWDEYLDTPPQRQQRTRTGKRTTKLLPPRRTDTGQPNARCAHEPRSTEADRQSQAAEIPIPHRS